uniref:Uncharacterized protein n=1 Tax=Glossina austeni TaxID=7395 RepID=A0A1A9V816_GLOAU
MLMHEKKNRLSLDAPSYTSILKLREHKVCQVNSVAQRDLRRTQCAIGVHSLLTDKAKILLAVSRMEAPALGGFGVAAPSTSLRSPLLELSSLGSESALLAGVARSLGATDSSGVLLAAPLVIEDGVLRPTPALGPVPPRPPPRLPGCDMFP